MQPMSDAPRGGGLVEVHAHGRWWRCRYQDCAWMRGEGGEDIADAWAIENAEGPGHIELDEAQGWRPIKERP